MKIFILFFLTALWIGECRPRNKHHKKHHMHPKSIITTNENSNTKNYLFDIVNPLMSNSFLQKDARHKMHHAERKNELQAQENQDQQAVPDDNTQPQQTTPQPQQQPQQPAPQPQQQDQPQQPQQPQQPNVQNNAPTTTESTPAPAVIYQTTPEDDESGSGEEETTTTQQPSPAEQVTTPVPPVATTEQNAFQSTPALAIPMGPSITVPTPAPEVVPPMQPNDGLQAPAPDLSNAPPVENPPPVQPIDQTFTTAGPVIAANIAKLANNKLEHMNKVAEEKLHLPKKRNNRLRHHHANVKHNVGHYKKNENSSKKGKVTTHTLNRVSQTPNAAMSQHAKSDTSAVVRLTTGNKNH